MNCSRTVEWRIDATNSRLLRALVYGQVAIGGGLGLLVVCGLVVFGATLILGGRYALLAVGLLFALIGGPLSLLYLWPMIADADQRPPLSAAFADETTAERYAASFSRSRLLAVVLGGALVLLASLAFDPRAVLALVAGLGITVVLGAGVFSSGRVSPDESTLTYNGRTVALQHVEGIRRLDVGGIALCWFSYRHGGLSRPRWMSMSRAAADAVEVTVAGIETEADAEYAPDRAVQAALAAFALCFLGLAGALFVVEPGSAGDPGLRWYLVVVFGFVAGLFGLAALFSG